MAELLSVPLKKSSDVEIVKPLKNLLQATCGGGSDGGEEYAEALSELARLRSQAIWKVFEKSSLDPLYNYYDQLVSLESKVPPHDVQIPFKWKDAFDKGSIFGGRMSLTVSSLTFERVCIQFNIAALQTALAAGTALDTDEALRLAAKLLQQAAGGFAALRAAAPAAAGGAPTPDLAPDTLQALHALALAQAQEVIAYKCIRDEMKASMVSRVCAACAEMYADAARAMGRDGPRALWEREWLPAVGAKGAALGGLAQLYAADGAPPGERVARLTLAVDALRQAPAGARALHDAHGRAARALQAAVKDNDFIYHERVPEGGALEPLARAPVAKPQPPPERYTQAPDLFGGLLGAGAAARLAAAAAQRAQLAAHEVDKLRAAAAELQAALAELNLPGCLEAQDTAGGGGGGAAPDALLARAAAVRAAGGLPRLRELMHELPELLQRNREILDEAERMLREEEEADDALRAQFGARWSRTASRALTGTLRANADKYRQIIDNAVRADNIVRDKLAAHEAGVALLGGPEEALLRALPAAPADARAGDAALLAELRARWAQVDALRAEREVLEAELKESPDELRRRLAAALRGGGGPEPEPEALLPLAPLSRRLQEQLARQAELLGGLRAAHAAWAASRGGAAGAGGREAELGRLAAAHDAFQELTGNLTEGVKFYNDLTQLLVAFQNKVADYCFARRTEKEELLKDLTQDASRAAPQPEGAPRREPPPRPPPPSAAPTPTPAPAHGAHTLPYPTQPHGMPQPAAGAGAGAGAPYPYFAAPIPTLYNPYATLPYPHHAAYAPPHPAPQHYMSYQYPPQPPHQ